jgi:hypothetical protein
LRRRRREEGPHHTFEFGLGRVLDGIGVLIEASG